MTAPTPFPDDAAAMGRALELARRGLGRVEPNPAVGAVLTTPDRVPIAEGFHEAFGGPHAEVHALDAAGDRAAGATLYVTLEPCNHHGKTPPCADAVLAAGVARVVIGTRDPAPHAAGGIAKLRDAGVEVVVGVRRDAARVLVAPFAKRVATGRPWVTAKWAMTLDGKTAARTGHARWISGPESRAETHALRGRCDAVVVGAGTLRADDPLLTARGKTPGPRTPLRVVVSDAGVLPPDSRLATTPGDGPVLVTRRLSDRMPASVPAHVEVLALPSDASGRVSGAALLDELGRRGHTNVLLEGGGTLAGNWFDGGLIDEAWVFLAPKLLGGSAAPVPLAGTGLDRVPETGQLHGVTVDRRGDDLLIRGRVTDVDGLFGGG